MAENSTTNKQKSFSFDWLIQGILTKLGDIFDTFTGRRWKPSSSLATSELTEKLKLLLDSKIRENEKGGKFVPHNIQLKMQWNKFSTDSEDSLERLENELLIAAVDHINNNRYHTYAPLNLEIKPDYFTDGVKLLANFGTNSEHDSEAEINVTVPDLKNVVIAPEEEILAEEDEEIYVAKFTIMNKPRETELAFGINGRKTVGRSGANDLWLDDDSVSKIHAALIVSEDGNLIMSDTGSTNGTFLGDERIAYGKAIPVKAGEKVKFGTIEVEFSRVEKEAEIEFSDEDIETEIEVKEVETSQKNLPKTSAGSSQIPIAQTITIKPETLETEGLKKKDFQPEKKSDVQVEMPTDLPFEEESPEKSIYDTNADKKEDDIKNELPATEQEIVLDFDSDEK